MKSLLTILMFLCSLAVSALDNRQKQINDIKKCQSYLYADLTKNTQEEATSQAFMQLKENIILWVSERTDSTIIHIPELKIKIHFDTIMTTRANMYRVFAYAKKDALVSLFKRYNLSLIDSLDCEQSVHANTKVRKLLMNNYLGRNGGVLDKIKRARNFFELREIMEPLKAQGDIIDYGKFASAENLEDCYLIVYDPAGNIKALLGKGNDERQNYKTGKLDKISNYRGCGAIWFKIKESIN